MIFKITVLWPSRVENPVYNKSKNNNYHEYKEITVETKHKQINDELYNRVKNDNISRNYKSISLIII